MHGNRREKWDEKIAKISKWEYTSEQYIPYSLSLMKHRYKKKSWSELIRQNRYTMKLWTLERHTIVKNYLAVKKWTWSIGSVWELCKIYKVSRNVPAQLLKKFNALREDLHPWEEINYNKNVFLEREKLRKHRELPGILTYKEFIGKYPRWWYQSYVAWCRREWKEVEIKEGMYYYYKEWCKQEQASRAPIKKERAKTVTAKEWYDKLYEDHDLVIHIDGKSMEDQERIWKNRELKMSYKWLSMWVEAKSGMIVWIWAEKSHNKSNALKIVKEICEHVKNSLWKEVKICFITDAWSEYVNNKLLRGIEITSLDTSKIAWYLREKGHSWRITRRPQDNSFVENKNDYVERVCLDYVGIEKMRKKEFIEHLEWFMERNNLYLTWSKKSYRGKITPLENIVGRFGEKAGESWVKWLHAMPIEMMYSIPRTYEKRTLATLLYELRPRLKLLNESKGEVKISLDVSMHTKSLDSSTN